MTHDTTKDPRILVAQLACSLLKKCVKQKPGIQLGIAREKLTERAAVCESAVMTLTYMYQEPEVLASSEPVKNLAEAASTLAEAYGLLIQSRENRSMLRADIRWCLRTLKGLGDRLGNPGTTMASGVDLVVVGVRNVSGGGGLLRTRVTDGVEDYAVLTNLGDVETNSALAVAFLPPREIDGTPSEAMFLTGEKREEAPGTFLTEEQVDPTETVTILYDELAKLSK